MRGLSGGAQRLALVGDDGTDIEGNQYIFIDCHAEQVWELHTVHFPSDTRPPFDMDQYEAEINTRAEGVDARGHLYLLEHTTHMELYRAAQDHLEQQQQATPTHGNPDPDAAGVRIHLS